MNDLVVKFIEALFVIGFAGLVLSHPGEFSSVVQDFGGSYANTVAGLQGAPGWKARAA